MARGFTIIRGEVEHWIETDIPLPASFNVINGAWQMMLVPEPADMPREAQRNYNTAIAWMREFRKR